MLNNFSPKYPHRRLARISSLEKLLDLNRNEINSLISLIPQLYRMNIPDKHGRITFSVLNPLKKVQERINNFILKEVNYPIYIHAYIKKRSCITNAKFHLNTCTLINEDIKKFFDNCSTKIIYSIWKNFFKFSDEISRILTLLTTFNNKLPQGASTSPALSNLVFWRDEPKLVAEFKAKGLTYTRYADDISISSSISITSKMKTFVISSFYGMLLKNGFKPKREKHKIFNSSGRMLVNGQNVNGKKIGHGKDIKGRDYLLNLRAAIYQLEKNKNILPIKELQAKCNSIIGKINHIQQYKNNKQINNLKIRAERINFN